MLSQTQVLGHPNFKCFVITNPSTSKLQYREKTVRSTVVRYKERMSSTVKAIQNSVLPHRPRSSGLLSSAPSPASMHTTATSVPRHASMFLYDTSKFITRLSTESGCLTNKPKLSAHARRSKLKLLRGKSIGTNLQL
jgi:hypothetical protein